MACSRLVAVAALMLLVAAPAHSQCEPVAGQVPAAQLQSLLQEVRALRAERQQNAERQRQLEERIVALERLVQDLLQRSGAAPRPGPNDPGSLTLRPGFKARLYGYARADVDVDTRRMFAGPHLPFWVLSPDDPRAANRADGAFTIHPRLTRLGLDTEGPAVERLGDARLSGKVEIDFFNILPDRNSATSNSRAFVRIRHAYGRLDWERAHLLFGQTWDLISPLFPAANYDVVMWNAGNLADRRPQLRFVLEPRVRRGKASLGLMVGSPSAVDSQDLDADQVVDGEESGRPTFQARVGLQQPSWVHGQTWEIGFWGHSGQLRINRNRSVAGLRSFSSHALGMDLRLPLTKRLLLQGEAWTGQALADVRGGVGQNINLITGEEVDAAGGWAEMLYRFSDVYTLGGGFTIDNPDNEDVTPFTGANQTSVGRTHNRSYYLVNRLDLGSGLLLGVDWMLFRTSFRGLSPGSSNRWNVWLQHSF